MLETYRNPNVSFLSRFDTKQQAERWLSKHRNEWEPEVGELFIGTHKKDGFVVYYFLDKAPYKTVSEYDPHAGIVVAERVKR